MSDVTGSSLVQDSQNGNSEVFSLHDEKNTVLLLRRIHQSTLAPDEKNELRDLVFSFRLNSESVVTQELTEKFAQVGIDLTSLSEVETPTESIEKVVDVAQTPVAVTTFGNARSTPQFGSVVKEATPSQTAQVIPAVQSNLDTKNNEPIAVSEAVTPDIPVVPSTPAPLETEVQTQKTEPVEQQVPGEHTEPEPPQNIPTPAIPSTERIKEIKKEVNALVGNPVNLIDVHNEVGREYMNALLDAMKKSNGGTPEEVVSAMERLEKSFVSVKETVGNAGGVVDEKRSPQKEVQANLSDGSVNEQTGVIQESVVVEEKVTPEVKRPPVQEVEKVVKPQVRTAAGYAAVAQAKEESVPEVEKVTPAQVLPATPMAPTPQPVSPVSPVTPLAQEATNEVSPQTLNASDVSTVPIESTVPTPSTPLVPTPSIEAVPPPKSETPSPATGGIMSVAKEKQIQDLMTAQKQEAATTDQQRKAVEIASMDPLMTPEVTNGLQQLLSEWSLFKSSGIFGTGANGMEHPLFKKLSVLNMTAVVAGRYEGATPQIKRSITDYMNGWRYEEGIMQEQGELFEHYLRRVIKHIIDKRK